MSDRIADERVTIFHTFRILAARFCSHCVCVYARIGCRMHISITFSSYFKVLARTTLGDELSIADWESDLKWASLTLTVKLVHAQNATHIFHSLQQMSYLQFDPNESNASLLTFNFSSFFFGFSSLICFLFALNHFTCFNRACYYRCILTTFTLNLTQLVRTFFGWTLYGNNRSAWVKLLSLNSNSIQFIRRLHWMRPFSLFIHLIFFRRSSW